MEPIIKSEPCEELYSAQEIDYQDDKGTTTISKESQPHSHLKRVHEVIDDTSAISTKAKQNPTNNSYYKSFEFPTAPQHFHENFKVQEPNQCTKSSDGKPLKKHKRLEANVLFNPPFFNLVEELLSPNTAAIAARCYSCGKVVKGHRGISSNFIKHMKRSHPETYKLYDSYKSHKTKSYYLPNLPEMANKKSTSIAENGASGSDSTAANSNDDTNQFFEASTVSEANALNDSSDDNEDLVNALNVTAEARTPFEFSAKGLETLGNIIDAKIKTYFSQKEYERLNEKMNPSTIPNTPCEVEPKSALTEFRIELDKLKKECAELRSAVQKSQDSKRQLQNELQTVDKLLHQRKFIIRNISVCDPENPIKSVQKLFKETMHLDDIKIVHCCIIPSVKTSITSNRENVSIELNSLQDCKTIFRHIQKLKNTGIYIESEISPFQRKRKNKLMVMRKELLRRKPDLKVFVRGTTLVVNEKKFYWDDVEGLCYDRKYEAIDGSGIEYLKLLCGLDLKEFVTFLQNYNVQT